MQHTFRMLYSVCVALYPLLYRYLILRYHWSWLLFNDTSLCTSSNARKYSGCSQQEYFLREAAVSSELPYEYPSPNAKSIIQTPCISHLTISSHKARRQPQTRHFYFHFHPLPLQSVPSLPYLLFSFITTLPTPQTNISTLYTIHSYENHDSSSILIIVARVTYSR